jgi:ABC-type lipoprotein release transport system permease subunit
MIPIRYNLGSIMERRITSLMTVMGVALTSMIFVILFGFIGGLKRTILNTGGGESWIVLSRGVTSEGASFITHDQVDVLRALPEIAMNGDKEPLLSMESFAGVNISRGRSGKEIVTLRGVTPIAYQVHRNMRLIAGHWPVRGNGDWAIGRTLAARFPYLKPGAKFHYGHRDWLISAIFSDNSSARESEIWTDLDDLIVDRHYTPGACNAIHVILNRGTESAFADALQSDGRLKVEAIADSQYYSQQAKFANQLRSLGLVVAIALAIGATFGGMNTMYTTVARREREIGVLRALGFTRADILSSFMTESVLLGFAGGAAGIALAAVVAWATGLETRIMSAGGMFFVYRPGLAAASAGLVAATAIGALGGLMPAWRAARITVIESLREA